MRKDVVRGRPGFRMSAKEEFGAYASLIRSAAVCVLDHGSVVPERDAEAGRGIGFDDVRSAE